MFLSWKTTTVPSSASLSRKPTESSRLLFPQKLPSNTCSCLPHRCFTSLYLWYFISYGLSSPVLLLWDTRQIFLIKYENPISSTIVDLTYSHTAFIIGKWLDIQKVDLGFTVAERVTVGTAERVTVGTAGLEFKVIFKVLWVIECQPIQIQ